MGRSTTSPLFLYLDNHVIITKKRKEQRIIDQGHPGQQNSGFARPTQKMSWTAAQDIQSYMEPGAAAQDIFHFRVVGEQNLRCHFVDLDTYSDIHR